MDEVDLASGGDEEAGMDAEDVEQRLMALDEELHKACSSLAPTAGRRRCPSACCNQAPPASCFAPRCAG